jgi:hypothetical protein
MGDRGNLFFVYYTDSNDSSVSIFFAGILSKSFLYTFYGELEELEETEPFNVLSNRFRTRK